MLRCFSCSIKSNKSRSPFSNTMKHSFESHTKSFIWFAYAELLKFANVLISRIPY